MARSPVFLCTVALTAFAMNALVACADFTFQTSPASKQILSANSGLVVRWDVQPGNSPDSNSPAHNMLTVSLGYRDPPGSLNKEGLPTLDANSQFFVVIADQVTGYRSNGQIFNFLGSTEAPAPAASVPDSAATPAASATRLPTTGTTPESHPSFPPTSAAPPTGGSGGGASGAPDAVASSPTKPTGAFGSSPGPGQGSDSPQTLIGFQSLWTMNLAFAGAFACMIIF